MNKIKEFYKNNKSMVVKMLSTQFMMSMLGLMIGLPVSMFVKNNETGNFPFILALIFTEGIFCFLVYDMFFQLGAKDFVKLENKTLEYDPLKGLKLSVKIYIPIIFLNLLLIIGLLFNLNSFNVVMSFIVNIIIGGMHYSFIMMWPESWNIDFILYIIILLPAIISASLGYYIAVKNKTLRGVMGFKVKYNKE